jgi:2-hydroxychromene-2-carboxylate isomerase
VRSRRKFSWPRALVLVMDRVTSLDAYRRDVARRRERTRRRPTFYFDLASPYTYLAAERADRMFSGLEWRPASSEALQCPTLICDEERAAITARARLLGLPIVWPMGPLAPAVGAMRVASLASERGLGAAFVLAASRLVFCGGFDIDEPEILAEAAAAAGIDFDDMLHAAGDAGRDGPLEDVGRALLAAGADRLPALRVGRVLFCGEHRLAEAFAARASA